MRNGLLLSRCQAADVGDGLMSDLLVLVTILIVSPERREALDFD